MSAGSSFSKLMFVLSEAYQSAGIAHVAKLLDHVETKRDIWLVMEFGGTSLTKMATRWHEGPFGLTESTREAIVLIQNRYSKLPHNFKRKRTQTLDKRNIVFKRLEFDTNDT